MIYIKVCTAEGTVVSEIFENEDNLVEWLIETLSEESLDENSDVFNQEIEFFKKNFGQIEPDRMALIGFESYTVSVLKSEKRLVMKDFDFYQELTNLTALYPEENALMYLLTGLASECGELQGKVAKYFRGDHPLNFEDITKEAGDILWFLAQLSHYFGVSLGAVAQGNIDKLQERQQRNVIKGSGDNR